MIVVSNASPIIGLAAIGHLDLLRLLYGKVIIPKAVYREISVSGAGQPGAQELRSLDWIETRRVTDESRCLSLETELGRGEAEAIILAIELKADLLLMDERRGRIVASRLGLKLVGLMGVVLEAKHRGLIPAVKPVVDDLTAKAGFRISGPLYHRVLQAAGE